LDTLQTPPLDLFVGEEQQVDAMVGEVAGLIGGDDDPDARGKAIVELDRAIARLNQVGIFLYRTQRKTYTLVEDQATLDLPTDFAWPADPIVGIRANKTQTVMAWVPWQEFRLRSDDSTKKGGPEVISILAEEDDVAHIFPKVQLSAVTSIEMTYYRRLQSLSEATEIFITRETREAIITGGEALTMRYRFKDQPRVWEPFMRDFERQMTLAKGAAGRRKKLFQGWARPHDGDANYIGDGSLAGGTGTVWVRL